MFDEGIFNINYSFISKVGCHKECRRAYWTAKGWKTKLRKWNKEKYKHSVRSRQEFGSKEKAVASFEKLERDVFCL